MSNHHRHPSDELDRCLRWLPYALFPSDPEGGRQQPEVLELRLPAGATDWMASFRDETIETVQVWLLDDVLKNFAMEAAIHHIIAGEFASGTRKTQTTRDEMKQWINSTRSLADRLPWSGPLKEMMTQSAVHLEQILDGPEVHFKRWPGIETKAHYDWVVSRNLWAADRLMRAVNDTEPAYAEVRQQQTGASRKYLTVPPTKFWAAMFDWYPADRPALPFSDYKNAQQRVSNLEKTIKPDMREALMVALLGYVLHNGRYRPSQAH